MSVIVENNNKNVSRIHCKNIFWIQINNKVYQINKQMLDSMEPDNILLHINTNEFNTEYNANTETLIYNEKIENINLIIDYLQGYTIDITTIMFDGNENNFTTNQLSELQRFIILASRLKMNNLHKNLQCKYPTVFIDNYEIILNTNNISAIEPNNTLLITPIKQQYVNNNCNYYHHYRCAAIFKCYLAKYILGIENINYTANNIIMMNSNKSEKNKQYEYNKILEDLKYYKFDNLLNRVLQTTIVID